MVQVYRSLKRYAPALLLSLNLLIAAPQLIQAQTLRTLYDFTGGSDGAQPFGTLIADKHGNLYGTTWSGGIQNPNCTMNGTGCGTVFKLTSSRSGWSFNVLYTFKGYRGDGSNPYRQSLVFDKHGNMYGTTMTGGDTLDCGSYSCGTVFKLAADGTETIIHNFSSISAGAFWPMSGLVLSKNGSFFGVTFHGGIYGTGTVYEVTTSGTERTLYNFTQDGADGIGPFGDLVLDKHGNLYGTTQTGGSQNCFGTGCGTVFRLAPDGTQTVLHNFAGAADGSWPWAALTTDNNGNLYGTTFVGGGSGCGGQGCGTVFKIAPDGTEAVLHRFSGSDGAGPRAGVILDRQGNLYGTTTGGGSGCGGPAGCGTVFKIAPDGTETVLHSFNISDGVAPEGGLVLGKNGKLYGTTQLGGAYNWGTVYELTP
jgi:uncharacterized repeat protein (TIGR03803 family)